MNTQQPQYGTDDNSYKAAGELPGIIKLVDTFFDFMDTFPEAESVRSLYPQDLAEPAKKLAWFLSGWLGGPGLYAQHYGEISIPLAHRFLNIGQQESDAWLACMQKAAAQQPWEESFKEYLIIQLRVPADRIVTVCGRH